MKVLWIFFLILVCGLSLLSGQGLTIDKIYTEIVAPLQHENFNLRLQIMGLMDQMQELQKRNAELEKKP